MHKDRPHNVGEALLTSLSAGVQGIAKGLAQERQSQQQERTEKLQNFMAVLRFEGEMKAQESQNIIDQKNMLALDKMRSDSKERERLAHMTSEEINAEKIKTAIDFQTALQRALTGQGLGNIPQFQEAGVVGDFTGLSAGGIPQFGAVPGLGGGKPRGLTIGQGINEVQQAFGRHKSSELSNILAKASAISIEAGGQSIRKFEDLQLAGLPSKRSAGFDFLAKDFVPDEDIADLLEDYNRVNSEEYRRNWITDIDAITSFAPELGRFITSGGEAPLTPKEQAELEELERREAGS